MLLRAIATAAILLTACAHPRKLYRVDVDALAGGRAMAQRVYYLVPGSPGQHAGDLQFREFATQTQLALSYNGFRHAKDADQAQVLVFLSYGIGEPRVEYETITSPVLGLVPNGTSTTRVSATTQDYGSYSQTKGSVTTTQGQTLGVTGYKTDVRKSVLFDRFVYLSAIDARHYRATGEIVEVWRTKITSTGENSDLRRVFSVMMGAAMRRLGLDTGGRTKIKLSENHPNVQYLRGQRSLAQLSAE